MIRAIVATALLLTAAGSAHADPRGWYFEAAAGLSDAGINGEQFNARLAADGHTSQSRIDETDMGFSARVGYQIDSFIGFELAATHYGETDLDIRVDTSSNPSGVSESVAEHLPLLTSSVSASMTFSVTPFKSGRLTALSLSAKLGIATWQGDVTIGSPSAGFHVVVDRESVDPLYAFAASYAMSETVAWGLELGHLDQGPRQSNDLLAATLKFSL